MLSQSPNEGEMYQVTAARMFSKVTAHLKNLSPNEICISLILAHLSKYDMRIKRLAYTNDIRDRDVLMKELRFLDVGRRNSLENSPATKKLVACKVGIRAKVLRDND